MSSGVLPKAELHCHIEGAADPELVLSQARKYGIEVSHIVRDGAYVWHDFTSFLAAYDLAASLFRSVEDYAVLAERHLLNLASQDAIYAEFFISIDHARSAGIDPAAYIEGLAEGMERARRSSGIHSRMIALGIRHFGPDAVLATARWHVHSPHPLVTGFGMAGDERLFRTADFVSAFDTARDAGLGITTHAGELTGPETVRESLELLKPSRVGHGVRAIEDPALVERIAEAGTVLEVCPVSNIALKIFPDFASHPLPLLAQAGCPFTLNSDDPPFFHTNLAREYHVAEKEMGLAREQIEQTTITAIQASFADAETRASLLSQCVAAGLSETNS